jgi:LysM repeat protein
MANKSGVAAGHYNGANRIPPAYCKLPEHKTYSEGTNMWELAQKIALAQAAVYNARPEYGTAHPWVPNFSARAKRLKAAGCNFAFELHTNWSLRNSTTPNRGSFIVIVSLCYEAGVNQAKACEAEKALAIKLWKPLADRLGLKFELRTRKGGGKWDYYSFINESKKKGIAHPMIIEHGYHPDFAENKERYMQEITAYYAKVQEMIGAPVTGGPVVIPTPQPRYITVEKGCSTLWAIHNKYKCDIEDIQLMNGKEPNPKAIWPGMKLKIVA